VESDQAFEDAGDFEERASTHALGVFLEAVFPVAVAAVFSDRQGIENLLDFPVANDSAQSDAAGVLTWNHDFKAAGFDMKKIEPLDRGADRAAADLFNNSNPVIGIDDLIADVEVQVRATHI
jgi:hypothetical protein